MVIFILKLYFAMMIYWLRNYNSAVNRRLTEALTSTEKVLQWSDNQTLDAAISSQALDINSKV